MNRNSVFEKMCFNVLVLFILVILIINVEMINGVMIILINCRNILVKIDILEEYDFVKLGLLKEFIKNLMIIFIIRFNMIIVVKFFDFIMILFISRVVLFF